MGLRTSRNIKQRPHAYAIHALDALDALDALFDDIRRLLTPEIDSILEAHERDFLEDPRRGGEVSHDRCTEAAEFGERREYLNITRDSSDNIPEQWEITMPFDNEEDRQYGHIARLVEIARQNAESATLVDLHIRLYLAGLRTRVATAQREMRASRNTPEADIVRECRDALGYLDYETNDELRYRFQRLRDIMHCVQKLDLSSLKPIGTPGRHFQGYVPREVILLILKLRIRKALAGHESDHGGYFSHTNCWDYVQAPRERRISVIGSGTPGRLFTPHVRELYELARVNWDSASLVRRELQLYQAKLEARIIRYQEFCCRNENMRERDSNLDVGRVYTNLEKCRNIKACLEHLAIPARWSMAILPGGFHAPPERLPPRTEERIIASSVWDALDRHGRLASDNEDHEKCWEVLRANRKAVPAREDPRWTCIRQIRDMSHYPDHQVIVRRTCNAWWDESARLLRDAQDEYRSLPDDAQRKVIEMKAVNEILWAPERTVRKFIYYSERTPQTQIFLSIFSLFSTLALLGTALAMPTDESALQERALTGVFTGYSGYTCNGDSGRVDSFTSSGRCIQAQGRHSFNIGGNCASVEVLLYSENTDCTGAYTIDEAHKNCNTVDTGHPWKSAKAFCRQ
ncbi:MAG: hypothetical protein Q9162_007707 [Coniocarpon cinnabarinum]